MELEKNCFICHEVDNLINLTENEAIHSVYDQITYLLPEIAILKGDVPLYICESCEIPIENFFTFKKLCLKNYSHWKNKLCLSREDQNKTNSEYQVIEDTDVEEIYSSEDDSIIEPNPVEELEYKNEITELYINVQTGEFNCLVCKESFLDCQNHLINHCGKGRSRRRCPLCNQKFKRYFSLVGHMKLHIGLRDFECLICRESFSNRSKIRSHINQHLNSKIKFDGHTFQCFTCDKICANRENLIEHTKMCLSNFNITYFECKCGQQCKTNYELKTHMIKCKLSKPRPMSAKRKLEDEENDFRFECKCGQKCESKNELQIHEKKCKLSKPCPMSAKRNLEDENIVHIDSGNRNFKCQICKKDFMKSIAENHVIFHLGSAKNTCSVCLQSVENHSELIEHMKVHIGLTDGLSECEIRSLQKCSKCDMEFETNEELNKHLHEHNINQFQCCICRRMFRSNRLLDTHLQEHIVFNPAATIKKTKEKKSSPKSKELQKRMKEFECFVCNLKFMTNEEVTQHAKIHEPASKNFKRIISNNKNSIINDSCISSAYINSTNSSSVSYSNNETDFEIFDNEINENQSKAQKIASKKRIKTSSITSAITESTNLTSKNNNKTNLKTLTNKTNQNEDETEKIVYKKRIRTNIMYDSDSSSASTNYVSKTNETNLKIFNHEINKNQDDAGKIEESHDGTAEKIEAQNSVFIDDNESEDCYTNEDAFIEEDSLANLHDSDVMIKSEAEEDSEPNDSKNNSEKDGSEDNDEYLMFSEDGYLVLSGADINEENNKNLDHASALVEQEYKTEILDIEIVDEYPNLQEKIENIFEENPEPEKNNLNNLEQNIDSSSLENVLGELNETIRNTTDEGIENTFDNRNLENLILPSESVECSPQNKTTEKTTNEMNENNFDRNKNQPNSIFSLKSAEYLQNNIPLISNCNAVASEGNVFNKDRNGSQNSAQNKDNPLLQNHSSSSKYNIDESKHQNISNLKKNSAKLNETIGKTTNEVSENDLNRHEYQENLLFPLESMEPIKNFQFVGCHPISLEENACDKFDRNSSRISEQNKDQTLENNSAILKKPDDDSGPRSHEKSFLSISQLINISIDNYGLENNPSDMNEKNNSTQNLADKTVNENMQNRNISSSISRTLEKHSNILKKITNAKDPENHEKRTISVSEQQIISSNESETISSYSSEQKKIFPSESGQSKGNNIQIITDGSSEDNVLNKSNKNRSLNLEQNDDNNILEKHSVILGKTSDENNLKNENSFPSNCVSKQIDSTSVESEYIWVETSKDNSILDEIEHIDQFSVTRNIRKDINTEIIVEENNAKNFDELGQIGGAKRRKLN